MIAGHCSDMYIADVAAATPVARKIGISGGYLTCATGSYPSPGVVLLSDM